MTDSDERRAVERLQRSERISVKVSSSPGHPEQVGSEFQCSTVNISPDGLEFRCPDDLSLDTGLELCITIQGSPTRFFLCGHVIYTEQAGADSGYLVGVAFNDKVTADLLGWRALFEE